MNAIRSANEKDGRWGVIHSGINMGNFVIIGKEERKEKERKGRRGLVEYRLTV